MEWANKSHRFLVRIIQIDRSHGQVPYRNADLLPEIDHVDVCITDFWQQNARSDERYAHLASKVAKSDRRFDDREGVHPVIGHPRRRACPSRSLHRMADDAMSCIERHSSRVRSLIFVRGPSNRAPSHESSLHVRRVTRLPAHDMLTIGRGCDVMRHR